jgi:endonuclease/exonuclease/phosphatase family metal-dependent hydrolase
MRLATFNIESLDIGPDRGADADAPFEARVGVLRPVLERLAADILCLQEVNGQHVAGAPERRLVALDRLLQGTRYETYNRAATTGPSGRGVASVHNLVTLSRYPIGRHWEVRHGHVAPLLHRFATGSAKGGEPQPVSFDRPLLIAEIEMAGGRYLNVINLHLRAPRASPVAGEKLDSVTWRTMGGWAEGYFLSSVKRTAQALELRLVVDEMLGQNPECLIAVAGDFNAEDRETPLRLAVGPEVESGNGGPAPQSLVVLDRAIPADRRWSVLHRSRPLMPDHILASRALWHRFRSIEVHNEGLNDEVPADGTASVLGSLHAPLVAELDLS